MKRVTLVLAVIGTLFPSPTRALAQGLPAPPPEAGQFDFWIGEWEVTRPDGQLAGRSRVEKIAGGHGLLENWSGARGPEGKSLNAYNTARRCWQQFWVGAGGVLELAGGLDSAGRMVLRGTTLAPDGTPRENRITWSREPDGAVRQRWEISADNGATWQTSFDGLYRRRS